MTAFVRASRTRPPHKGAVIAIGHAAEASLGADTSLSGSELSIDTLSGIDESFELPPSPKVSTYKLLPAAASPELIDNEALKTALIKDVRLLLLLWGLRDWLYSGTVLPELTLLLGDVDNDQATPALTDLTELVEATKRAIQSVRNYFLALPSTSISAENDTNRSKAKDRFRRQSSFSGASRPGQTYSTDTIALSSRTAYRSSLLGHGLPSPQAQTDIDEDPLAVLRRSALDVLSALREAEQRSRPAALVDDSPELDPFRSSTEVQCRPEDLKEEREIVQQYLATVDKLLSRTKLNAEHRVRKAASTLGIHTQAINGGFDRLSIGGSSPHGQYSNEAEQDQPEWASKHDREADMASCIRSFIVDHFKESQDVDQHLLASVTDSGNLEDLLHLLADGYVLCKAFNAAVARSDRPWGFIQTREIHDLRQEEADVPNKTLRQSTSAEKVVASRQSDAGPTERPGWTFRRAENLRAWAAALKLRYAIKSTSAAIPVTVEPVAVTNRGQTRRPEVIEFDPAHVARKDAGWQPMLVRLIGAWLDAVASECA